MHFKKTPESVGFCVVVLILKMEERKHFWHSVLYYFKKGKNATETQRKIHAVYGEGAVPERVQSGLRRFVLEMSC